MAGVVTGGYYIEIDTDSGNCKFLLSDTRGRFLILYCNADLLTYSSGKAEEPAQHLMHDGRSFQRSPLRRWARARCNEAKLPTAQKNPY
jgi:hypothetical protein